MLLHPRALLLPGSCWCCWRCYRNAALCQGGPSTRNCNKRNASTRKGQLGLLFRFVLMPLLPVCCAGPQHVTAAAHKQIKHLTPEGEGVKVLGSTQNAREL